VRLAWWRNFNSHAEADAADALFDAQLSPDERIRMVIELRDRRYSDAVQRADWRPARPPQATSP